ncbi:MAG TPA: hypothetical protein EYP53_09245 [Candidatus Latescibacteria bacterium]|nr:hypothetical protein [Candidatus Latescibacterota bacterium]
MIAETDMERMQSWLEEELKCYQCLHQLAFTQREILQSSDLTRLHPLLEKKDRWIEKIAEIEVRLAPLRAEWLKGRSIDQRKRGDSSLNELIDRIRKLLKGILTVEEETGHLLSEKRRVIEAGLKGVQKGKSLLREYFPKRPYRARFLDMRR